jgi:drug/metabolite transporter (DMT)-like permease
MSADRTAFLATLAVVGTGAFWGFYWLPVRQLAGFGLPGAWGTLAIVAAAVLLLFPLALKGRRRLAKSDPVALLSVALGGVAFTLYSVGFVYGRVAIIILLFFLTPVWSTLLGKYLMGWETPRLRLAAIAVGLTGLAVMLAAGGEVPIPEGTGEWLALLSGILWSFATTGMRAKATLEPGEASFVFAMGALFGALALSPLLEPTPAIMTWDIALPAAGWALAAGGLWWGASLAGLMWAAPRLDPARVGILLMSEVLVGTASAALFAGERLSPLELTGGALVLVAGVLEVWPVKGQARNG